MPCAPSLSLTELDTFLAFAKDRCGSKTGKASVALMETLRVTHHELMPWRQFFTAFELGFRGLDSKGTPIPETEFQLTAAAPQAWRIALPTDFSYALETVRTRALRAFWPVFQDLGSDGKAVSVLNMAVSRLDVEEGQHWFERLEITAPQVSPSLWAAWQQHLLEQAMSNAQANVTVRERL